MTFTPSPRTVGVRRSAAPSQPAVAERRGSHRLSRVLAAATVGGPLAFFVGALLTPTLHDPGAETIAKNAAASPGTNAAHLVAFVLASYLLPLSAVGLAWLAHLHGSRRALLGGLVAVVGWLPFSGLTALDDLGAQMAAAPDPAGLAGLLDRFTNDPVMNGYLVVYAAGHLLGYVILGLALGRVRAVPRWAAACLVVSTPLTLAVFAVPGRPVVLGMIALGLVVLGSVPAARAHLRTPARPAPAVAAASTGGELSVR